jgi:hypothetical protein
VWRDNDVDENPCVVPLAAVDVDVDAGGGGSVCASGVGASTAGVVVGAPAAGAGAGAGTGRSGSGSGSGSAELRTPSAAKMDDSRAGLSQWHDRILQGWKMLQADDTELSEPSPIADAVPACDSFQVASPGLNDSIDHNPCAREPSHDSVSLSVSGVSLFEDDGDVSSGRDGDKENRAQPPRAATSTVLQFGVSLLRNTLLSATVEPARKVVTSVSDGVTARAQQALDKWTFGVEALSKVFDPDIAMGL